MTARCWLVQGAAAMRALGVALGRVVAPGTALLLSGPLGAGKTTLAQGIGEGLGVEGPVVSPTFTLLRELGGAGARAALVHMDFYRLADAAEVAALGVADYLDGDAVVVIEWPERAPGLDPRDTLRLRLEPQGDGRRVTVEAQGERAAAALATLAAWLAEGAPERPAGIGPC
jgi:tRNA threonylcarbamoyladenosine biosynthesis protein TsaE